MKRFFVSTVFLAIFAAHATLAAEEDFAPAQSESPKLRPPIVRTHIPTLVETVRFSGDIHLCGEKIPFTDPEVRERLEKEMMLAVWNRPQVMLWLKRAHRWFPHIESVLKQEKLPLDLKYLPIVESALLPHGRSYKGAVGYWQFIKSTGKRYGLRIDSKVDERRNMFFATRAACRYIKDLYSRFGSYLLAMSAYNMGENGLSKAMARQDTRDFFSLYLPLETQRYILKMVAVKLIMSNPERYGFHLEPQDLYPVFTFSEIKLSPKNDVPLSMVAKACDVPFKTIKDYNPQLRGYHLEKGSTTLLVPKGKDKGFYKKFPALYKALVKKRRPASRVHVVKAGENLSAIAEKYNISLSGLLRTNKLSKKHIIHPGDKLRVQ
ncbi:lytic transglycosylase domain-containing protein [Desulfobacter latus]|uniref:Transglycosylase SLT domain-containing protein n=1 Tax=Desulfobacter latus TaxID=2292 RepID=A0A850T7Y6_9BACT|nr:lytic transglycosylase domain-containing protein [Desulfobacter latus]NWH04538.1 transglycosylase SLT domain-containing protein [Desulfobacter latus]